MTTSPALFDPGLQPERTALAWRRTALSVAIGSIVSVRVLPAVFEEPLWYVPGVIGVGFAAWMWWESRRRHVAFSRQLGDTDTDTDTDTDGAPTSGSAGSLLALVLFTVSVGAVGVLAVLLSGY